MPPRQKQANASSYSPMYTQLLLFPERAEYLEGGRFESYRVSLEHWAALAVVFREAFETVYERNSARVLLVHGGQGHGKSLFVYRLDDDFQRSRNLRTADSNNLWHVLTGGSPIDHAVVERAAQATALRRVEGRTGWLDDERSFARQDTHAMRVFLFDDAHKDVFIREWSELSQGDYARLKADNKRQIALESAAQKIVEDCRGDFRRSLLVLFSNDQRFLDDLKIELDRSHQGLARRVELPLPEPAVKEEIVRTNTNLLNQRSYWFCLDQGGPDEKVDAYRTLVGERGFIDAFQAINRALAAQSRGKRPGRPANKNLLTLVTVGTPPSVVQSFLTERELEADESADGPHVATWWFRNRWASGLKLDARRAGLVESEFALRWVALDMVATWRLCVAPDDDALANHIADILRSAPSIADSRPQKDEATRLLGEVNHGLAAVATDDRLNMFASDFRDRGQARSRIYEPPLARRLGRPLSASLGVKGSLKPDVVLSEYEPCAVTNAPTADVKAIELAIRRACHVIEITAHLQDDMRGLDEYLAEKVGVYADLLESV